MDKGINLGEDEPNCLAVYEEYKAKQKSKGRKIEDYIIFKGVYLAFQNVKAGKKSGFIIPEPKFEQTKLNLE